MSVVCFNKDFYRSIDTNRKGGLLIMKDYQNEPYRISGRGVASTCTLGAILPSLKSRTLWNKGECLNLYDEYFIKQLLHIRKNNKFNLSTSNIHQLEGKFLITTFCFHNYILKI